MTTVLPYHVGPEERYSLVFVNPDRQEFEERLAERAMERGSAVKAREVAINADDGPDTLYAVYVDSVPKSVVEGWGEEEMERILDREFTNNQLQVLDVLFSVFIGITDEVSQLTVYKEMNLPKIPEILEYPDWGGRDCSGSGRPTHLAVRSRSSDAERQPPNGNRVSRTVSQVTRGVGVGAGHRRRR